MRRHGFQQDTQVVRMNGAKLRIFLFDFSVADKRPKRFFKSKGASLPRKRYLLVEILQIVSANVMPRHIQPSIAPPREAMRLGQSGGSFRSLERVFLLDNLAAGVHLGWLCAPFHLRPWKERANKRKNDQGSALFP
jgi:hypothetical protein